MVYVVRQIGRLLWLPMRVFLSIRRSMTPASVTLLLVGIVTLNIVWGYPWTGMFSACVSMLFVGWLINRLMRPQLKLDFSLPNSAPAQQSFQVQTHAKNARRVPSMEISVAFVDPTDRPRSWRWWRKPPANEYSVEQENRAVSMLRPSEVFDQRSSLTFSKRGIQDLPDLLVTSSFPFHLFRSAKRYNSETQIAITPRPLTGEEDTVAAGLLNTLGGWSHRLLSGDALDYTGSREYEVGMPVRRWDFVSWARLGKPIVREYQSPSIRMVMLIVDTSPEPKRDGQTRDAQTSDNERLERLLSLAATAVNELSRRSVQVRLYVTGESTASNAVAAPTHARSDSESLLIRLAAAEKVTEKDADQQVIEVLDQVGRSPVLILCGRSKPDFQRATQSNVTLIRVDLPTTTPPESKMRPQLEEPDSLGDSMGANQASPLEAAGLSR